MKNIGRITGFVSISALAALFAGGSLIGVGTVTQSSSLAQRGVSSRNSGFGTVRPIDGAVGISSSGELNGLISVPAESQSRSQTSIALAIGSYSSPAAEDAAIVSGTRGSKNFKVISQSNSNSTIDLSQPWTAGTNLPNCDQATLLIRVTSLSTGDTASIVRLHLTLGTMTQIPAIDPGGITQGPAGFTQPPTPEFTTRIEATRSVSPIGPAGTVRPIDGSLNFTLDSLSGKLKVTQSAFMLDKIVSISYISAGRGWGQSMDDLSEIFRLSPGYSNGKPHFLPLDFQGADSKEFSVGTSQSDILTQRGSKVAIVFKIVTQQQLPDAVYKFKRADGTYLITTKKRFRDVDYYKAIIVEVPGAGTVRPIDLVAPTED